MDGLKLNDVGAEPNSKRALGQDHAASLVMGAQPALPLPVVLWLAAIASSGTSLMITGIYFYMANQYRWGLKQNFLLAAGQGAVYIVGALNSHRITQRLRPRNALAIVYTLMAACAIWAMVMRHFPMWVSALLLLYTIISVISWPILESQVTTGTDSHTMSKRISTYNLVWAATGVFMLAVNGAIIQHLPIGVFLWPAAAHVITMAIVMAKAPRANAGESAAGALTGGITSETTEPPVRAPAALHCEPDLLRSRTLALWLSRLALPATYVVIYGLMSLMPSLPIMQKLDPTKQTLVGSIWMASRWVAFLVLGLTTWWHTRPRLLLAAAMVMLVAFVGVTVRPTDVLHHSTFTLDLLSMSFWQLALGACMGVVYSCSLYFGMVLSHGSTEHGGYHEALIGLGQVLGPGAGAIAAIVRPGNVGAGIMAVGSVIFLSAFAVVIASLIGSRREAEQ